MPNPNRGPFCQTCLFWCDGQCRNSQLLCDDLSRLSQGMIASNCHGPATQLSTGPKFGCIHHAPSAPRSKKRNA